MKRKIENYLSKEFLELEAKVKRDLMEYFPENELIRTIGISCKSKAYENKLYQLFDKYKIVGKELQLQLFFEYLETNYHIYKSMQNHRSVENTKALIKELEALEQYLPDFPFCLQDPNYLDFDKMVELLGYSQMLNLAGIDQIKLIAQNQTATIKHPVFLDAIKKALYDEIIKQYEAIDIHRNWLNQIADPQNRTPGDDRLRKIYVKEGCKPLYNYLTDHCPEMTKADIYRLISDMVNTFAAEPINPETIKKGLMEV